MKKIILSILALVLLAIGVVVFFIIGSFNTENYKTQVSESIKKLTGYKVEIKGSSSLAWTPRPTFVMENLTIKQCDPEKDGQKECPNPELLLVKKVQVEMDWLSFFRSPLIVKKIVLVEPDVFVERKYSYQTNFAFPILFQPGKSIENESLILDQNALSMKIDALEIQKGKIHWYNYLTGQNFEIQDINGMGMVETLDGPYAFKGNVNYLGQKFDIDLETGKIQVSHPLFIKLTVQDKQTNTQIKTALDLDQESKDKWLSGGGTFSLGDPQEFLDKFGVKNWPLDAKMSGSFKLDVAAQQISLYDLILSQKEDDEALLSANINWDEDFKNKQNELEVTVNSIDLSKWTKFFSAVNLSQSKHPTKVEVVLNKVNWNKLQGEQLQLNGNLGSGEFVGKATASFLYDTSLILEGKYRLSDKHLTAKTSFGSADLLALIHSSMTNDNIYLPKKNFKKIQLSGQLDVLPSMTELDIRVGSLDQAQILGKISYVSTSKKYITNLKIENLDASSYYDVSDNILPDLYHLFTGKKKLEGSQTPYIFEAKLDFNKFNILNTPFDRVQLHASYQNKDLMIDKFDVIQSMDNTFSFEGKIKNFAQATPTYEENKIETKLTDFDLAKKLGIELSDYLTQGFDQLVIKGTYSGTNEVGKLDTTIKADEAELTLVGEVKQLFSNPQLNQTNARLIHPNLARLVALFWPTVHFFNETPAIPVDAKANVVISDKEVRWTQGDVSLAGDTMLVEGAWEFRPMRLRSEIHATRLNPDVFQLNIDSYINNPKKPFELGVDKDFSMNLSVFSDIVNLNGIEGRNLKGIMTLENKQFQIKDFSLNFSEKEKSALKLTAKGDLSQGLSVQGQLSLQNVPLKKNLWQSNPYALGEGFVTSNISFNAKGNDWQNWIHSLSFTSPLSWANGTMNGVDAKSWQEAINTALKVGQMSSGFNSRLQYAFKNGQTKLPTLTGTIQAKDGKISFQDVKGENNQLNLTAMRIDWTDIGNALTINMPFVLKSLKLPAIVLEIIGTSSSIKTFDFTQAFQDIVKIKSQEVSELKNQELRRQTDAQNAKMQQEAKSTLDQTEKLLHSLEKKVILSDSKEAANKLKTLNNLASDIRQLALKSKLTQQEHEQLVEKSKLLSSQAKDFDNWFKAEDLMTQKKNSRKVPFMVEKILNEMEKIYQDNPRSVIMAELVMNTRQSVKKIRDAVEKLESTQNEKEVQNSLSTIQDNYLKVQKASEYMEKLNMSLLGANTLK